MKHDYAEYALVFKALSDPTRIKIISLLAEEKLNCLCANNILKNLNITQPTLSYHMKFLHEADLVTVTKEGTFKNYSFNAKKLSEIHHFIMNMDKIYQNGGK
ncbi:transcriptional regulator [Williamsoniiplasma somnilux]|uniref:Transcriptional regulator n=1 Tax=Williamsoniiplasma somnilux TaxID=215578 RepID=A0A2K8NYJ3_9MOLU|nr:metalloregulator ArsR/SmtB family transcription factor [Williamsoniiplasma somnilux]ATZ18895.1 transcriptional regulator [Williamsoniiplasma somnilux]